MSRLRPFWPYLAITFFALFAAQPLARAQMICSDDSLFHITRAIVLDQALRAGHIFPRWIPQMAHGYGFPFFNYYAPLTYYIFAGLHRLGLIYPAALHLFFGLCVWLAGVGMYLFVGEACPLRSTSGVYEREAAGLAAAVTYLTAPYLAYNVFYRAALAETFALVWPPILLVTLHRALTRSSSASTHFQLGHGQWTFGIWHVLAALSLAAMLLTHNVTSLAVLPVAAGYIACLALAQRDGRKLVHGGAILFLGFALSAHLWLPALAERDLVQYDRLLLTPFASYYLTWTELLGPPKVFDPLLINPSPAKGLGLVAALLALLGFAAIVYRSLASAPATRLNAQLTIPNSQLQTRQSWLVASFFLLALLGYAALTLPISRPIWDHVPLLPSFQLPWRFLGPAAMCAAVLAGGGVYAWPKHQGWLAALIVVVAALGHLSWWYPRYCEKFAEISLGQAINFEYASSALGTMVKSEFLPATVQRVPEDDSIAQALMRGEQPHYLTGLPEAAQLTILNPDPLDYRATLTTPHAFRLTFAQFYFPGWRATLDGQPAAIQLTPDTGLMAVLIPPGTHRLSFHFGSTPIRTLSDAISLVALLAMILLAAYAVLPSAFRLRPSAFRLRPPAFRLRLSAFRLLSSKVASHPHTPTPSLALLCILGFCLALLRFFVIDRWPNPLRHSAFDGQSVAGVQTPLRADFAGGVRLYGTDLSSTHLPADGAVEASLYASTPDHVERHYWPAFTIEDQAGLAWVDPGYFAPRWQREPPPTPLWPPNEYAQWTRRISLLPGTPPGTYQLFGSVFDVDSLQIASMLDEQGNAIAPRFSLGALTVTRPSQPFALQPENPTPHAFGPLTLLGYRLSPTDAKAGDSVLLTLYWKSQAATQTDYTAHVDFVTPDGASALGMDLPPVNAYPTSRWRPGDQWRGQQRLRIPATLADGDYQLSLSLTPTPETQTPSTQTLGTLRITAPARTFKRPAVQVASGASFEGVAVLEGYSVKREGDTLTVTLVWRATDSPALSYAVFVHLADDSGRVWAQSDSVPVNWTRPTTGWVPGEYLVDAHALALPGDLPAGGYRLFVGLYDPQSGDRVPAAGPGAGADNRVEIGEVSLP